MKCASLSTRCRHSAIYGKAGRFHDGKQAGIRTSGDQEKEGTSMHTRQHRPAPAADPMQTLVGYADQPLGTSDLVLLCSVGPDLAAERTTRQLRRALCAAGFPGPATGYLIGISPLLRRCAGRRYRLREFHE